jgi:hypothetical protein
MHCLTGKIAINPKGNLRGTLMNRKILSTVISVLSFFSLQFFTLAQTAHGQLRPYKVTDTQVRNLLSRIETGTDTFRNRLNNALDSSSINGSRSEDQLTQYVNDFESSTDNLRQRFDANNLTANDVQNVLSRASYIDRFMRDYRLTTAAQNQWNALRGDLTTLAGYYRVSWNWNNPNSYPNPGNDNGYPNNNNNGNNNGGYGNNGGGHGGWDSALTGTYRLNRTASDDVQSAVDRANNGGYSTNQRNNGSNGNMGSNGGRGQNNLIRRLTPPDMIAIQKNNREITIASDMAPQVVITADGIAHSETSPNGRTIRTTASTQGNGITINYEGDRMNDFYVSFMPAGRDQLRVVRRVYIENSNQTITVASVYDRTSPTADWSAIDIRENRNNGNNGGGYNGSNNPNNNGGYNNQRSGDFIIPDGTRVIGVLDTSLSTRTSNNGDKFSMRVSSPAEYSGAIIAGYISNADRSGRVAGRANMTLNFEQIQLRNGTTYQFAGTTEEVRLPNGEKVTVSNEGEVRDSSQTKKTAVRSGIGAALGAIIGAVAGGGTGAAIGAGVGAGAGAGSVLVQGKDDLNLDTGTEFVITASAPQNLGRLR